MTDGCSSNLPCVVLFNINGSGMGHLSTCLAYANRLRGRARPVFFSLASAMEFIHDMGFEGDYMVSRFWSRASSWAWDQQLAQRLGMLFEQVKPDAVVFDGTWPYRGLLHAAKVHGVPKLVWSNLVLYKPGTRTVPVSEGQFDLVIRLGEIGTDFEVAQHGIKPRKVTLPPVTVLRDEELLDRTAARAALGLRHDGRYALFSLGPGNLKNVDMIGRNLIDAACLRGFEVVWARAPITVEDTPLPGGVTPIAVFPLARYLRAFDVLVAAAGYNTCCEVVQSRIPTLFVPNELVSDDQVRRAEMVADCVPAVISPCKTREQADQALAELLARAANADSAGPVPPLSGADLAADEILALVRP